MNATYIAAGAFILNLVLAIVGGVWGIANIKNYLTEKMAEDRETTSDALSKIRSDFLADQKTQDHTFGETGQALRRFAEGIEREMHAIEIWGRDNYALKSDVTKATDEIRADIKTGFMDMKTDMRRLEGKLDQKA